jgi:predicted metal-dependent HD superfamily phosphohydrolase
MNIQRWYNLMHALGLPGGTATYAELDKAYREPHRHYHTTRHLQDCLAKFDLLRPQATRPDEIELALWFHDAVYLPYRSGNEEKSADWAVRFLADAGAGEDVAARVRELILATRHDAIATDHDSAILVDVDLSILGADRERYDAFEADVRKEYRWVPRALYRRERRKILGSFLQRERIFVTADFCARYEAQARHNLERAIRELR